MTERVLPPNAVDPAMEIGGHDTTLQALLQENLNADKRKQLLEEIEKILSQETGKDVAVAAYISNTLNPMVQAATSMNLAHVSFLDDLIRRTSEGGSKHVALMVESYGGEATFPSEILSRARAYSKGFSTIMVNIAKSAATMLALLSDEIIAMETASFGPVDPQLVFTTPEGPHSVSARSIIEMMEVTIPQYLTTNKSSPAERAAVLASQNYEMYQAAKDASKLVEEIIESNLRERIQPEKLAQLEQKLVRTPLSHALGVSPDALKDFGFPVRKVGRNTQLGTLLMNYHRRALRNLMIEQPGGATGLVLFESRMLSMGLNAQVQMMSRPAPPRQTMPLPAGVVPPPLTPDPTKSAPPPAQEGKLTTVSGETTSSRGT
ncbi:MAG: hypothetical protein JRN38_02545 [Nitrososphaerota archaeon]|nr:hypothetical protein [Nitrososphaerota archaeon]